MTQKTTRIFIYEIYSKPTKTNYATNKTNFYHVGDIWSLDIIDLRDYGPVKIRNYRYVLVGVDNFSKFGWYLPLKSKNAQTNKDSLEYILLTSRTKPELLETHRRNKFCSIIFQIILNNNNIESYSRNTSLGAVFSERFNESIRNLPNKPVFEKRDSNCVDELSTITK